MHSYMEDYLFKGHDSFPNNFDITLPKKYQGSKISITLSKESHYNCLTDNNLQYNLSLTICDDGFRIHCLWKEFQNIGKQC